MRVKGGEEEVICSCERRSARGCQFRQVRLLPCGLHVTLDNRKQTFRFVTPSDCDIIEQAWVVMQIY